MWWEKTVEYAFVRNILPRISFAFPLDGNAEKAFGDLLLSDGTQFRLIEFKAQKNSIQDERKKWGFTSENYPTEYKAPFQALLKKYHPEITNYEGHHAHWLIYGSASDGTFKLKAQGYCAESDTEKPLETRENLDQLTTVKRGEMLHYLDFLEKTRGSADSGNSSLAIIGVAGGSILSLTVEAFRHACDDAEHNDDLQSMEDNQPSPSSRPRLK
ncbi:hypothetical protein GSY71_18250 [Pusillimonas sp. TS35]|nr:hypothetical protein [Pusillimonas sp. TS35]